MKSDDLVIMDWGIGGLSVYNEVMRLMPGLPILYYSDSGQTPYGKMPSKQLQARLLKIISHFAERGHRCFVIACNAASTALPGLEADFKRRGLSVTGIIDRGVELVQKTKFKRVGVIGGRRTILSRKYSDRLSSSKRKVISRIAQPLSALIEQGELSSPLMTKTLMQILRPLRGCDSLLLACTHYPAVSQQIQSILPDCQLLDPASMTAVYLRNRMRLQKQKRMRAPASRVLPKKVFITSGSIAQMKQAARLAFGVKIDRAISLDEFLRT
jgi:glutamate racemase